MTNYWLVKTEPGAYSFADLERERATRWTGVSNPLAKKHLRAMQKGDLVFVYHTGNEKQIVGIAQVVTSGDEPQLQVRERLNRPVTLSEIKARKEFADPDESGKAFAPVRMGRLSVMPVSPARWKALLAMAK